MYIADAKSFLRIVEARPYTRENVFKSHPVQAKISGVFWTDDHSLLPQVGVWYDRVGSWVGKARRRRKFFGFCLSNTVKNSDFECFKAYFPRVSDHFGTNNPKNFLKIRFFWPTFLRIPPLVSDPGQTRGGFLKRGGFLTLYTLILFCKDDSRVSAFPLFPRKQCHFQNYCEFPLV